MHAFKALASLAIFLGLASSVIAQNGLRGCIGGAINCKYQTGRCAKICTGGDGKVSSICECPNGPSDNPYIGAGCIDIIRAAGRHSCGDFGP
ncbi:hypothetical protein PVAG01_10519 [Phlyctema vagabunda]|uniref:Uncharacterized protein n=1 Tax=Phlyctema vagabunda TaxID=108571 RepID=A0ABR4P2I1_9HELO